MLCSWGTEKECFIKNLFSSHVLHTQTECETDQENCRWTSVSGTQMQSVKRCPLRLKGVQWNEGCIFIFFPSDLLPKKASPEAAFVLHAIGGAACRMDVSGKNGSLFLTCHMEIHLRNWSQQSALCSTEWFVYLNYLFIFQKIMMYEFYIIYIFFLTTALL